MMRHIPELLARTSLRTRMVIAFFIFDAIVLLALSVYYYNQTTKAVTEEITRRNTAILDILSDNISCSIGNITDILYRFSYDPVLRGIMTADYSSQPEKAYLQQMDENSQLSSLVDKITNDPIIKQVKIYFPSHRIYTENSYKYFTFDDVVSRSWYEDVLKKRDQICWATPAKNIEGRYPGIPILSVARTVSDWNNPEAPPIGFLEVEADIRLLFSEVIRSVMKETKGDLLLINENGIIICALNSNDMGKNIQEKLEYDVDFHTEGVRYIGTGVFFIKQMEVPNWYIISRSSLASFREFQAGIFHRILNILVVCFVIILTFNIMMSKLLTIRLSKLQEKITQSNSAFEVDKDQRMQSRDELENISKYFSYLTGYNQHLLNEIYKAELQKKEAEINALQSQIKPHFLYNVLDSINWMAIKNGQEEISRSIRLLAQYYRGRLSADNGLISLTQELEHCQNYIALMNIRFNNILEVKVDIPPSLMAASVIRTLFQPFIENSIQHGILETEEGYGTIWITARADSSLLIITIEDNGVGISNEVAEKLNNGVITSNKGGGVGFSNTNKRIKLTFGEEYGAEIQSMEFGTRVLIKLPLVILR
ncbi:MAG: cache domain-containing sensor histidine kinase [Bacillota bacterium]